MNFFTIRFSIQGCSHETPKITSAIEDLCDTILVWTSKALITIQEVDQMTGTFVVDFFGNEMVEKAIFRISKSPQYAVEKDVTSNVD